MNRRKFLQNGIKGTVAYSLLASTMLAGHPARAARSQPVSEDEIEYLMYMREEEKLARDVYLTMYGVWGLEIFNIIAESEQMHTDAVRSKIEKYDLEDPVTDDSVGVFVNENLASLFATLVEQGRQSELDALYVGAAIEEIDMIDIQHAIDEADHTDIIRTYSNLMEGSKSHLRGFVDQIEARGVTYTAQYLSQEIVDEILSGSSSRRT